MMVLYSGSTDPFSQRCRFVLFEKGMDFEIRDIDLYHKPEDINVMNPYGEVPILVERDLVLYESNIINEYIDERFPHPQLMPLTKLIIDPIFGMMGAIGNIEYQFNVLEIFGAYPVIIFCVTVLSAALTALYTKAIKSSDTASIE